MIAIDQHSVVTVESEPLTVAQKFRTNLRGLMEEFNVTQQELALRLSTVKGREVSRASVSQLINGDHCPRLDWVEMCARCFPDTTAEGMLTR